MKRILIVEQTETARDRLSEVFERRGCWTITAGTIYEALTLLPDFAPEVIVLGVQLPDGSGLDLLGFIKRERPGTRVIVVDDEMLHQPRCLAALVDNSRDLHYLSGVAGQDGGRPLLAARQSVACSGDES